MFGVALALIGLVYIVAQWLIATSFRGYWRMATFLPLPILATIVIGAIIFDMTLPFDTVGILLIGLPLGLVYLTALAALHLAVQSLRTETYRPAPGTGLEMPARIVSQPQMVRKHG